MLITNLQKNHTKIFKNVAKHDLQCFLEQNAKNKKLHISVKETE